MRDSKIKEITTKVAYNHSIGYGKYPIIRGMDIRLKRKGFCKNEKNENTDASYLGTNAEGRVSVCLSLKAVTSLTRESYSKQIPALLYHELAHAAGYGEDDAKNVQTYILERLSLPCEITIGADLSPSNYAGFGGEWYKLIVWESDLNKRRSDHLIQIKFEKREGIAQTTRIFPVSPAWYETGVSNPENSKIEISMTGGRVDFPSTPDHSFLTRPAWSFIEYSQVFHDPGTKYYARSTANNLRIEGDPTPRIEFSIGCFNK